MRSSRGEAAGIPTLADRRKDTPRLRRALLRLRKRCPVGVPVRVVRVKRPVCRWRGRVESVTAYASTIQNTRTKKLARFRITLSTRLSGDHLIDVLAHEWAHCMDRRTRSRNPRGDVHDTRWGQHYSRAWRATFP